MKLEDVPFGPDSGSISYVRAWLNGRRVCIDRNADGTYDIWGGVSTTTGIAHENRMGIEDPLTAQCVLLDYLERYT